MTTRMQSEHAANLALHHSYMVRGWMTGTTFTAPSNGRSHYTPEPAAVPIKGRARGYLFVVLCSVAAGLFIVL